MKKFLTFMALSFILIIFGTTAFAKPETEPKISISGKLNLGYNVTSTTGREKLYTALDAEARQDDLSLTIRYDLTKEQTEDELIELKTKTEIQCNYYFSADRKTLCFLSIGSEKDTTSGLDARTDIGLGVGRKALSLKWQTGLYMASQYYSDNTLERDLINKSFLSYQLLLFGPFSLNPTLEAEINLSNIHNDDYTLSTDIPLNARLNKNLSLIIGYYLKHTHNPPKGYKRDWQEWRVALGVNF